MCCQAVTDAIGSDLGFINVDQGGAELAVFFQKLKFSNRLYVSSLKFTMDPVLIRICI
mgnify:CR=1 FL=1